MHGAPALVYLLSQQEGDCDSIDVSWCTFAQMAECGMADGSGWVLQPTAAQSAVQLTALMEDGTARTPTLAAVSSLLVVAPQLSAVAGEQQQWCTSEEATFPSVDDRAPSLHNIACLAGGSCCSAVGLLTVPLTAARADDGATAMSTASMASSAAFEQSSFTYEIQWQAATTARALEALNSSSGAKEGHALLTASASSGLQLVADSAATAVVGGGLDAGLRAASRLCIQAPTKGCSLLNGSLAAAHVMQLVQCILASGSSGSSSSSSSSNSSSGSRKAAVHAHTFGSPMAAVTAGSGSASGANLGSSMLAAMLKVAAIESPDHSWATLVADSHERSAMADLMLRASGSAADQHGECLRAGVICQPKMLHHSRYVLPFDGNMCTTVNCAPRGMVGMEHVTPLEPCLCLFEPIVLQPHWAWSFQHSYAHRQQGMLGDQWWHWCSGGSLSAVAAGILRRACCPARSHWPGSLGGHRV